MLLDHIFKPAEPIQIVIVRKNGNISHTARPVSTTTDNDQSKKPMFPISKDRK